MARKPESYIQYVNPYSIDRHTKIEHTLPGADVPFGAV